MMHKTVYLRLTPRQTAWERKNGIVTAFGIESCTTKRPASSLAGVVVELNLEVEEELFKPIVPMVSVVLERGDASGSVEVIGTRVRSQAAKKIKGQE